MFAFSSNKFIKIGHFNIVIHISYLHSHFRDQNKTDVIIHSLNDSADEKLKKKEKDMV